MAAAAGTCFSEIMRSFHSPTCIATASHQKHDTMDKEHSRYISAHIPFSFIGMAFSLVFLAAFCVFESTAWDTNTLVLFSPASAFSFLRRPVDFRTTKRKGKAGLGWALSSFVSCCQLVSPRCGHRIFAAHKFYFNSL